MLIVFQPEHIVETATLRDVRHALQESVRQVRGIAAAQVPDVTISVAHGVGGMFAASSTIVFSKAAPRKSE